MGNYLWQSVYELQARTSEGNLPLFTYPAVAGYLQKGECGDGKVEVRWGKFI